MKQTILAAIILYSLTSCRNEATPQGAAAPAAIAPASAPVATAFAGDIDPVCGMVRDSTWTDYTMYKDDTVWFCAAPEKKAFLANPEKYMKRGTQNK